MTRGVHAHKSSQTQTDSTDSHTHTHTQAERNRKQQQTMGINSARTIIIVVRRTTGTQQQTGIAYDIST